MAREPDAFDELGIETTRLMAEFVSTVMRNAVELETRRELAERLHTQGQVVQHMQTALWVWAVEGETLRLDYANAASVAATGLEPVGILGRTIEEVLPGIDAEMKKPLLNVLATGAPLDFGEVEYGDERLALGIFTVKAFPLAGGRIAVTFDNVTEARRVEEQLRQAQKMEAVGRLAGGIAHDFNNLLTAISGYSEFLIERHRPTRGCGATPRRSRRPPTRAAALTGQLLAFSRRQVLQPQVLDLNAVVGDMDMMLRRLIGEDVELMTMLEPELARVLADPTQIEQVIVNLAVNARDAMPDGGTVTIETAQRRRPTTGAFVELPSDGHGRRHDRRRAPAALRAVLHDQGQAARASASRPSTGSSSRAAARSRSSRRRAWAPPSGSACPPSAARRHASASRRRAATRRPHGDETILLVEDEPVVRAARRGDPRVERLRACCRRATARRRSSCSAATRAPIDLLVTDVVMPGMSGPEVASAVRAMRPGTQVLYISGYTDSAIGHHGVLEPGHRVPAEAVQRRRPDPQGAGAARRRSRRRGLNSACRPEPGGPGLGITGRSASGIGRTRFAG